MGKGKKKKKQRAIIRREHELSESKTRRNRMVMISSVIIAIVAVSIYFGFFASGDENETVQSRAGTETTVTTTRKGTETTTKSPESPQPPTPKPTTEPDSNPKPQPAGLIKGKWIDPQVGVNVASIPVSEVKDNVNVHFGVETDAGKMNYMAYTLDDQIHVRANVCPPCRSIGFSLQNDILVCDRCKTTFEAGTGNGVKGACVDYPKAAVSYSVTDGNIVMSMADLKEATTDTLTPG